MEQYSVLWRLLEGAERLSGLCFERDDSVDWTLYPPPAAGLTGTQG